MKRCPKCGHAAEWLPCGTCDGEGIDPWAHDCGEDCCMCVNPEPNVRCDICRGRRGGYVCRSCDWMGDWEAPTP
jgi:hypothetical protein